MSKQAFTIFKQLLFLQCIFSRFNIAVLYDENMVEEFGNKENVSSILENVFSFAQYWMKHETLEIKFDLKFEMIHMEDVYMDLDARNLELVVDFINGYEGFPYADYVIAIWYEDDDPPLEFFGKLCNQNPPLEVDYEWFFSGPGREEFRISSRFYQWI